MISNYILRFSSYHKIDNPHWNYSECSLFYCSSYKSELLLLTSHDVSFVHNYRVGPTCLNQSWIYHRWSGGDKLQLKIVICDMSLHTAMYVTGLRFGMAYYAVVVQATKEKQPQIKRNKRQEALLLQGCIRNTGI